MSTIRLFSRKSLVATGVAMSLALAYPVHVQAREASEPTTVSAVFNDWVQRVMQTPSDRIDANVERIELHAVTKPDAQTFEPAPVVMGTPDLPLSGEAVQSASSDWSSTLNYQGLHMELLVLSRDGKLERRSTAHSVRPGEYFKIRLVATFPAVAAIDQVVGDPWYGRRAGQAYPQPGMSVAMNAGELVDLPLQANQFFSTDDLDNERLVLSVRHAKAVGEKRSNQPAYRLDTATGSNYLQLIPGGHYPAIEQVIGQWR